MDYLNNLPYCLIGAIGSVLVAKNLINETFKKNFWYDVIVILIYALISSIIYSESYSPLQTVLEGLILTLSIKILFDFSVVSSAILSIISLMFLLLSELVLFINFTLIENISMIRTNPILFCLTHIATITIAYLLSKIKFLQKIIKPFIFRFENKRIKGELILLVLTIAIISFFNYEVFINRNVNNVSITFLLFMAILILFTSIYIWNKNRYKDLEEKYNNLFEYACKYEEELEKDRLLRHEHKNQLAVIKGLTKNKKVLNYVDEILENNKKEEYTSIRGINYLPKGGLRGLLYYKLYIIKKNNIKFSIDVSKSVKRYLSNLSVEEIKILTYVIGVCCDNAIEECIKDKSANISIEMYKIEKDLKIIITNTLVDKINLKKLGEKGYSTKGKKHGNGLYLVKRILNKNDRIILKHKIINDYFVQELKIKNI